MAIQHTVTRIEAGKWKFEWSVGTSPYQIWLKGKLIVDDLDDEEYEYFNPNYVDSAPPVEILNDGDSIESDDNSPLLKFLWRGTTAATAYLVEKFEDSAWATKATVMERELGYYSWTTPAQADETTAQWRVRAVNLHGEAGTGILFTVDVVRNPDPPDVNVSINSIGDLVVSEAS